LIKVYIAGPLTGGPHAPWPAGRREHNVNVACALAAELIDLGFQPFAPHLSHYIDRLSPVPISYETWMAQDFEWLSLCDCLYRLPGDSPGADREVDYAREHGIPVFESIAAVEQFRDRKSGPRAQPSNPAVARLWEATYCRRAADIARQRIVKAFDGDLTEAVADAVEQLGPLFTCGFSIDFNPDFGTLTVRSL
jgi:hypothetical protein